MTSAIHIKDKVTAVVLVFESGIAGEGNKYITTFAKSDVVKARDYAMRLQTYYCKIRNECIVIIDDTDKLEVSQK